MKFALANGCAKKRVPPSRANVLVVAAKRLLDAVKFGFITGRIKGANA